MGLFSSALNGAVEGAQEMVLMDTFDRYQSEINALNKYIELLSLSSNLYRALAEGQLVSAAKNYGNYQAARVLLKDYCNFYPEEDKKFIPLKKKFVEEYARKGFNIFKQRLAARGCNKIYASVDEINQNKMDFITQEEVISEAMIDPDQNNQNPSADTNYVSPFGPFPSKGEKKKEKSSYWLFGKK
jgi:hypothetical protein